ncbi:MAG: hypothetical protein KDI69_01980 [Xanthomonadales bacterium]|nr:hypothetical protein [Xanthomonadales bacterium]
MRTHLSLLLAGIVAMVSHTASAYEPESGLWWNPAESGTGYQIEIQDDMLAITVYGGAPGGVAKWYGAAGRLQGNAYFEADLLSAYNVQVIGQPYFGFPTAEPSYGRLKIVFDPNNNRRATLTWPNGRSIPIQRQEFYFVRPEDDAGVQPNTTRLLGEWQVSIDLSDSDADYPFSGDVLVFDDYYKDSGDWYYEGCRPDDAQVGGCSNYALTYHDAVGYFESPTGLHVNVVKDGIYNGQQWYALYVMQMGTNDGSGEFTLYPQGANPDNYAAHPARTFRSASRTFVQEGVGPAKRNKRGPDGGLAAQLAGQGVLNVRAKSVARFDRAALAPVIRKLEAKLEAR